MYQISELAAEVGLSRTALLYYEKLGLVHSKRLSNGYRVYNDDDVQRIRLIQQLQAGGLTLHECQACLDAKLDRDILNERLKALEDDIVKKQQAHRLLSAMLGKGALKFWHEQVDKVAPDAHLDWLNKQGFSEKEALRLKWLSRDMNEHDQYMTDFMKIYEPLDFWGPGNEEETLRALAMLPSPPQNILEIGCGKGLATVTLAKNTNATITAIDNEQSALSQLSDRLQAEGLSSRVTPACMSMTSLSFDSEAFDLIWSEGSAYIMGVPNALVKWKPLLKKGGFLVLSDLVWLTPQPSPEAAGFWAKEYPDIQTVEHRIRQIKAAGYEPVSHFTLGETAWKNYYEPLKLRIKALQTEMPDSTALADIRLETEMYDKHLDEFGYEMFILQLP